MIIITTISCCFIFAVATGRIAARAEVSKQRNLSKLAVLFMEVIVYYMLCYVVLCYVMLCYVMLCYIV